jgi:hypothetical protein
MLVNPFKGAVNLKCLHPGQQVAFKLHCYSRVTEGVFKQREMQIMEGCSGHNFLCHWYSLQFAYIYVVWHCHTFVRTSL